MKLTDTVRNSLTWFWDWIHDDPYYVPHRIQKDTVVGRITPLSVHKLNTGLPRVDNNKVARTVPERLRRLKKRAAARRSGASVMKRLDKG